MHINPKLNARHFSYRGLALLFFVLILTFLCHSFPMTANAGPAKTIKVGYIRNYGMGTTDSTEMYGYTLEYLNRIAEITGWTYEFIECSGSNYFARLENGEIDLAGPVQYNVERANSFIFSKASMIYGYQYIIASENSPLYYNDFDSFHGMTVGVTHGTFYNDIIQNFAKANHFTVELVPANGQQIREQLVAKVYDAAVITSILYLPEVKVIAQLDTVPFYFAASQNNVSLMRELDDAMKSILYEDPYYSDTLYLKSYKNTIFAPPAYTREEAEFIKNSPVYRVVCTPDWQPFEIWDENTGTYTGINIDMLNSISDKSGLQFTYLPTSSYEESLQMLLSGQADLLLGNTELLQTNDIAYTDSYLSVPITLASRHSVDIMQPLSVAIASTDTGIYTQIIQKYPQFQFVEYEGSQTVIEALKKDIDDAAFINLYSFNEVVRKESLHSYYTLVFPENLSLRIGIGPHVAPLMKDTLNTTLKRFTAEEKAAVVFSNTAKNTYKAAAILLIKQNSKLTIAILTALFVLIISIIFLNYRSRKKAVEKVAYVDSLTGLSTGAKFRLDAVRFLRNAKPDEYMLLYLDINNFQYINSIFGYDAGDRLLHILGSLFLEKMSNHSLFGRISADNFVLLLKSFPLSDIEKELQKNDILPEHLKDVISTDYHITFSIGVFHIYDPHMRIDTIIDNANQARKHIKGKHANSIAVYDADLSRTLQEDKEIIINMEHALNNKEFAMYLQPKFSLHTNKLIGAEALVRWQNPIRGLIMPEKFIPLFEKNGFIQKLDIYMFEQVCQLIARWSKQYPTASCLVSVNLSRYCIGYQHLTESLLQLTRQYGISPNSIEIELTESIATNNLDYLKNVMQNLKNAGFNISIDDFGSGYSSLALLTQLPANTIKIDRSFLTDNYRTENGKELIHEIIRLIHSLHMYSIAEGIETNEQAECLRGFSCDFAQGFLYGKPMPSEQFEDKYLTV